MQDVSSLDNDVFHDLGMWIVVVLLAGVMLITVIGVGFVYYGDDVARPAWNERSVTSAR